MVMQRKSGPDFQAGDLVNVAGKMLAVHRAVVDNDSGEYSYWLRGPDADDSEAVLISAADLPQAKFKSGDRVSLKGSGARARVFRAAVKSDGRTFGYVVKERNSAAVKLYEEAELEPI